MVVHADYSLDWKGSDVHSVAVAAQTVMEMLC